MKRSHVVTAGLLLGLLPTGAYAQDAEPAVQKPTVVVLAFDTERTGWMPPPGFGETVAELLTDRLITAGAFRVVDPRTMAPELDDRGRLPLAIIRDRVANAGVQFLVVGAVTRLSVERRSSTGGGILPIPFAGGLVRKHKTESIIGLTLRVIDLQSGEIVVTATAEGDGSMSRTSGGGVALIGPVPVLGAKGSSATGILDGLLATAVQEAVVSVAQQLTTAAPQLISRGR
jgi:curli biogenesis system outer membrane secretion channel CsgG